MNNTNNNNNEKQDIKQMSGHEDVAWCRLCSFG